MCMNGLLVIMAFGLLFGLWPSSFFVLPCDHFKNEVPPIYMCKCENDQ